MQDTRRNSEQRASIAELLADELEAGLSIRLACMKVGVSEVGIQRWKKRAREGDDEAIQLVRKLSAAQARGARKGVDKIWAAAEEGDTRAIMFLLERVYPQDFGPVASRPVAEYVEVEEPEEPKADPLAGYGAPERREELARIAAEVGLHRDVPRRDQQQAAPRAQADPIGRIARGVRVALSGGERDHQELTDSLCDTYDATPEQVFDAYDRLGVEVLPAKGRRTMLRLPEDVRLSKKVVTPPATSGRMAEPERPSEDRPVRQALPSGGIGTGDAINRARRRAL